LTRACLGRPNRSPALARCTCGCPRRSPASRLLPFFFAGSCILCRRFLRKRRFGRHELHFMQAFFPKMPFQGQNAQNQLHDLQQIRPNCPFFRKRTVHFAGMKKRPPLGSPFTNLSAYAGHILARSSFTSGWSRYSSYVIMRSIMPLGVSSMMRFATVSTN